MCDCFEVGASRYGFWRWLRMNLRAARSGEFASGPVACRVAMRLWAKKSKWQFRDNPLLPIWN